MDSKDIESAEVSKPDSSVLRAVSQPIVLLGLVYAAGFIIVSTHLARYAHVTAGALEPRHLAAGILFFVSALVPLAAPIIGERVGRNRAKVWGQTGMSLKKVRLLSMGVYLTTYIGIELLYFGVMDIAATYHEREHFLMYLCLWATLGSMLREGNGTTAYEAVTGSPEQETLDWILAAAFVSIVMLTGLTLFSASVYPNYPPAYGGGAVPVGTIALKEPMLQVVPLKTGQRVAVVDRRDGFTSLITCADGRNGVPVALVVPDAAISGIVFEAKYDTVTKFRNTLVSLRSPLCQSERSSLDRSRSGNP